MEECELSVVLAVLAPGCTASGRTWHLLLLLLGRHASGWEGHPDMEGYCMRGRPCCIAMGRPGPP